FRGRRLRISGEFVAVRASPASSEFLIAVEQRSPSAISLWQLDGEQLAPERATVNGSELAFLAAAELDLPHLLGFRVKQALVVQRVSPGAVYPPALTAIERPAPAGEPIWADAVYTGDGFAVAAGARRSGPGDRKRVG